MYAASICMVKITKNSNVVDFNFSKCSVLRNIKCHRFITQFVVIFGNVFVYRTEIKNANRPSNGVNALAY